MSRLPIRIRFAGVAIVKGWRLIPAGLAIAGLIVGATALSALVLFAGLSWPLAALIAVVAIALVFEEGAFRIWDQTDDQRIEAEAEVSVYEAEAEIRNDFMALGQVLGHLLAGGLDIRAAPDEHVEAAAKQADLWLQAVANLVTHAFGLGEHAVFLAKVPLELSARERASRGVDYVQELLETRAVGLPLSPHFDPQPWVEATVQEQVKEAEESEDQS